VSINEVIKQNINSLEDIAEYKNIKISVAETTELMIEMDFSLANVVVSNLLRNAIFHNKENGNVNIEISETGIQISNSGINTPINEQKLFSRFHKNENNTKGTGLGLAIVKAVCDLYAFSIFYHFKN